MMSTIQLAQRSGEEPSTLTMETSECIRFIEAVNRLEPGKVYLYEEADGTALFRS